MKSEKIDKPAEPVTLSTEEVAKRLKDFPKEAAAWDALGYGWDRGAFRELWLEHVGGNVTSKARAAEARKVAKEGEA